MVRGRERVHLYALPFASSPTAVLNRDQSHIRTPLAKTKEASRCRLGDATDLHNDGPVQVELDLVVRLVWPTFATVRTGAGPRAAVRGSGAA